MIPALSTLTGNSIPKIGLGTWLMGGDMKYNPNNDDLRDIEAIKYAIDHGISWIRTAQNYAEGYTLNLVQRAISNFARDQYQLCLSIFEGTGTSKSTIERSVHESLKLLGVEYLDMVIIVGINPDVSVREIAHGLRALRKNGLARDIGVGNYRLKELKCLLDYSEGEIVYNELQYSLLVREPTSTNILDYQQEQHIILGAYRPLHLGQLAQPGISILDEISARYRRTPAEIALKWLVSQKGIMTMTKTVNPRHLDMIADLFNWELASQDLALLTNSFPLTVRSGDCIPPVTTFMR